MTRLSYQPPLMAELARWLYSIAILILVILLPLVRPFLKKVNIKFNKERFGFFSNKAVNSNGGGILLHCASVGEVVAASPLVKKLQQKHPEMPVTITTTTETGAQQVEQSFKDTVTHYFLPFDLPFAFSRLLKIVRPSQVLITEVELWPNTIHQCWKRRIPVTIINARLTDKSRENYQSKPRLFGAMLQKINHVCAQGQRDFENYQQLGLAKDALTLTNNMKFDLQLSDAEQQAAQQLQQILNISGRKILLGASTHDPEETALIESYHKLKSQYPELLLVLVPRHPQRFDDVTKLLTPLNSVKLSSDPEITEETEALLVDQMGVLKSFYFMADIAFVGGSLADKGGHNALEAALFSKPVIMGPHIYNNPAICASLVEAGALKIIQDSNELCQQINTWLEVPEDVVNTGKRGFEVIENNSGAINKTLRVLNL